MVQPMLRVLLSGLLLIIGFAMALVKLHEISAWAIFVLIYLVAQADTLAMIIGKKFGKQKLMPLISPNKTWEGLYASMLGALLLGITLHVWFAYPLVQVTAVVLLVTAISAIGDLFISCYKREAGLKDTGTLLPGHGGMLDRIDGLLAAAPVFYVLTYWTDMPFVISNY